MAAGFATRRPGMRDRAAVTPCASPSARYVSVVSRVALPRPSTATEVRCGPEATSHPIVAVATAPATTGHNTGGQGRRRAGTRGVAIGRGAGAALANGVWRARIAWMRASVSGDGVARSEEHTSELQSPCNLVCRLLLEKK